MPGFWMENRGAVAPWVLRSSTPAALLACATLACSAAPALAAPPEKPVVVTQSTSAVTPFAATLQAEVNPENETTSCTFEYGKVITEHKAPCEQGTLEGGSPELATLAVSGLKSASTYHYRVVVKNAAGEVKGTGIGTEEEFTTLIAEAPIVEAEGAPFKAIEATLEAVINPNFQETGYKFEYSTKAGGEPLALEGPITTVEGAPPAPELPAEFVGEGVGVSTGAVLTPNTTYYYRVVAENATPPATDGPVQEFKTAIHPETPEALAANPVTGTTAQLNGIVNPKNEGNPGSYEFLYRESKTECQGGTPEEDKVVSAQGSTGSVDEAVKGEVTGLLPKHQYTFCLLAHNEVGEESTLSTPVTFESGVVSPAQVETSEAEAVTTTSAELGGELNPGGEAGYYFEYGTEPCGTPTPARCGTASAESGPLTGETQRPAALVLSGLKSNTTYHYWLVAKNAAGTIHSESRAFRTAATQAEAEAEAAAAKRPEEELAAGNAIQSKLEAEARGREATAAAAAAAAKKQYEEIAAQATALLTPKLVPAAKTTVPKPVICKKGFTKKNSKCVRSKKKKKAGNKGNGKK